MRIDNHGLFENQIAQTGKTDQSHETARLAQSRVSDAPGAAGTDRVELSDSTGSLAQALKADARQREARVQGLAAAWATGSYQVDARAVSKAIVTEMRTSGHAAAYRELN
jgi:flagellar biosynthesis anti-sigma factor FlgM